MKIKGTFKKNKPSLNKRYGDPIEYTPAEKVPLAVKDALKQKQPEGEIFLVEKVVSSNLQTTAKEVEGQSRFENNSYSASGTVFFRRHVAKTDRLYPVQEKEFQIVFEDSKDDLNLPDLSVVSFQLT